MKQWGWQQGETSKQYLENVSNTGKLNNMLVNINYVKGEIKPILNYKKMKRQPNAVWGVQWRQCLEANGLPTAN